MFAFTIRRGARIGEVEDLLECLDSEVRQVLSQAYAPRSQGPLGTALRSLASFAARVPSRELFRTPRSEGDLKAIAWNEWTFILFVYGLDGPKSTAPDPLLKKRLKRYRAYSLDSPLRNQEI